MALDQTELGEMILQNIEDFGVAMTHRRQTGASTFNTTTGQRTGTTADESVTGIPGRTRVERFGDMEAGVHKRHFSFRASDLASGINQQDRIIYGTETWRVERVEKLAADAVYRVDCVRVSA